MKKQELISALEGLVSRPLAEDLIEQYLLMRQDVLVQTLGRSAPGKFVETIVQILEYLHTGKYSQTPKVDGSLQTCENQTDIDESLRVCAARIARAMYSLRSKRNIVHKGPVDPNVWDLQFLHASAQWILAELIRLSKDITMDEAGELVAQIEMPVGGLVQDFGENKLVLSNSVTVKEEILILMAAKHPDQVTAKWLKESINRKSYSSVIKSVNLLWKEKAIQKIGQSYALTGIGLHEVGSIYSKLAGNWR